MVRGQLMVGSSMRRNSLPNKNKPLPARFGLVNPPPHSASPHLRVISLLR